MARIDVSHAIRKHFDRLTPVYRWLWGDHLHHGYWEHASSPAEAQVRLIEHLAAFSGVPRGAAVLDIGCGVAGSARWLAKQLDCTTVGITMSAIQAILGRQDVEAEHLQGRIAIQVMDLDRLSVECGRFDVVWLIESSQRVKDKALLLRRCAEALKPGGRLALAAWFATPRGANGQRALVEEVCESTLYPSLGTVEEYIHWIALAGLTEARTMDVTRQVGPTWDYVESLLRRPDVSSLIELSDPRTRRFAAACPQIREAYAKGILSYAFLTARKPA